MSAETFAEVEDALGRPVAIENVSYYVHPGAPEMSEVDFVLEVLERSGCRLLLDVNNVYVNARNHGFDPRAYLDRVPAERVVQLHVAGHLVRPGRPIIDTHAEPVCDDVYDLVGHATSALDRFRGPRLDGPRPAHLPPGCGFAHGTRGAGRKC